MPAFADHIIYADESGSPVMDGIDPDFPVFVLAFLIVRKSQYADEVVPALQRLKFEFMGHDQLVLHERDIRRQSGDFAFLRSDVDMRHRFLEAIGGLVEGLPFDLICCVVDKVRLKELYPNPWSPYRVALHFCMERALDRLLAESQTDRLVHCVFESRGSNEDRELELAFRQIASNQANWGYKNPNFKQLEWSPLFVRKICNSAGLQLADLCARPVGLNRIRPDQPNRAFDAIAGKIPRGMLKWFP